MVFVDTEYKLQASVNNNYESREDATIQGKCEIKVQSTNKVAILLVVYIRCVVFTSRNPDWHGCSSFHTLFLNYIYTSYFPIISPFKSMTVLMRKY